MSQIEDAIEKIEWELSEAQVNIAALERCLAILRPIAEGQQPEPLPGNAYEEEQSGTIHQTRSGFVGVYPVGKNSKKWYASVTEQGKTKRLPSTYDTAQEASTGRSEYLVKRDGEPEKPESDPKQKRTFGPSNDQPV